MPIIKDSAKISQKENSHFQSFMQSYPVQTIDNSLVHTSIFTHIDILKQHTKSEEIKLYCVSYMRDETESFAYTRAVLDKLDEGARKEIVDLGGNKGLVTILDKLKINGEGNKVIV